MYRIQRKDNQFESILVGAVGQIIRGATSAFCTEVAALDIATSFLQNLVKTDVFLKI